MKNNLIRAWRKTVSRLAALTDGSAWFLILPFLALWYYIDPVETKTMVLWLLRLPIAVGVSVILSRIVFPTLRLGELVKAAKEGSVGAGVVVLALILFVGVMVVTAAGWSK